MKNKLVYICFIMIAGFASFTSCKKKNDPHVPPSVEFKTSLGYCYKDTVVGLQDTLNVGIVATKTEDDLKSYNVSYSYDGATTTSTFYNYLATETEYTGLNKDVQIITRNQAGSEKWIFSIVDRDGNITQKQFTLTVQ
ncbi:MAG: hypothetical protein RI922_2062 [Bacteroidota bacterium]|jgi:hypothetical protein